MISKKTRLDEIVEEEWPVRGDDGSVPPKLLRIAERAFQHGVYQHNAYMRGDLATETESRVQPAPAEEKCRDCGHAKHEGWGCVICGSRSVKPFCIDRRSGNDRRKK